MPRKDPRNVWRDLSDPSFILPPTVFQLYPKGWTKKMRPCRVILGNWLDATSDGIMTKQNVRLIVKASGTAPNKRSKPPNAGYGHNLDFDGRIGLFDFPVNHQQYVACNWEEMLNCCIHVWQTDPGHGYDYTTVFVHCNEGINRAPALLSLMASKLHNSWPHDEAKAISQFRAINAILADSQRPRVGDDVRRLRRDQSTWDNMHCVVHVKPKDALRMSNRPRVADRLKFICHLNRPAPAAKRQPKKKVTLTKARPTQRLPAREEEVIVVVDSDEDEEIPLPHYDYPLSDMLVVSPGMLAWVNKYHNRKFGFNKWGRHVLHELAEQWRKKDGPPFCISLFVEAVSLTKYVFGNLDVRTIGQHPPNTPPLTSLVKASFPGATDGAYEWLIHYMVLQGADVNAVDNHYTTCVMAAAGNSNEIGVKYFVDRADSLTESHYKWGARNYDGRNAFNLVNQGGACQEIRDMFLQHPNLNFMKDNIPSSQSLVTARHRFGGQSSAHRRHKDAPLNPSRAARLERRGREYWQKSRSPRRRGASPGSPDVQPTGLAVTTAASPSRDAQPASGSRDVEPEAGNMWNTPPVACLKTPSPEVDRRRGRSPSPPFQPEWGPSPGRTPPSASR